MKGNLKCNLESPLRLLEAVIKHLAGATCIPGSALVRQYSFVDCSSKMLRSLLTLLFALPAMGDRCDLDERCPSEFPGKRLNSVV